MSESLAIRTEELETVVFLDPTATGGDPTTQRVGGVPVLLRMLRVLQRVGVRRIRLVSPKQPDAARKWGDAVGLEILQQPLWSANGGSPALILAADLAFQKDFIDALLARWRPSQWLEFSPNSDATPSVLLGAGLSGDFASLDEVGRAVRGQIPAEQRAATVLDQPCLRIANAGEARRFHRLVEGSMTKDTDAMFARWNRKVSIPLTRVLVHFPISPNMMTYITLLVSALGAWYLSLGGYWEMLLGGVLTQVSSILDGNDGELARIKVLDSDYGTWLDTLCDYLSYFLTFGGFTVGLYRSSGEVFYLELGGLLLVGIALGMVATSYFRRKHTSKGKANELTKIVIERLQTRNSDPFTYVTARLRHFATRATFSYFIVLFGLLYWWHVLLWFAVVGAYTFLLASIYNARFLHQK